MKVCLWNYGLLLLLLVAQAGCVSRPAAQGDVEVDALLWSTASAEYDVITRQVYFQAGRELDRLLAVRSQESAVLEADAAQDANLPLAVIVDIDETVLGNGGFYYQLLREGGSFSETAWSAWLAEARCKPVPGALDYAVHAARQGVTVFYVSNRDRALYEPTWRNLRQLGFPLDESRQTLVMRTPSGSGAIDDGDKGPRRAVIARHYRVVQVIGDSLDDFLSGTGQLTPAARRELSSRYLSWWGEKWFMLPNPVYGDWENAILNQEKRQEPFDALTAKYRFIRGGESQGVW